MPLTLLKLGYLAPHVSTPTDGKRKEGGFAASWGIRTGDVLLFDLDLPSFWKTATTSLSLSLPWLAVCSTCVSMCVHYFSYPLTVWMYIWLSSSAATMACGAGEYNAAVCLYVCASSTYVCIYIYIYGALPQFPGSGQFP